MHDATHDMPHHCRGATASSTADRRGGGGGCSARTQRHACARATCGSAGSACVERNCRPRLRRDWAHFAPSAPGLSCLCTRRQVGATHPADTPCEWPVGLKFGQYALQQCNDLSERSPELVILRGCDWLGHRWLGLRVADTSSVSWGTTYWRTSSTCVTTGASTRTPPPLVRHRPARRLGSPRMPKHIRQSPTDWVRLRQMRTGAQLVPPLRCAGTLRDPDQPTARSARSM